MEARELLLLLIAFAGAVIREALFAPPSNVTYSIDEESCHLQVRWLPVEPPNSNCKQMYYAAVYVDGNWGSELCIKHTSSWKPNVPLGKKIDFGIRTYCHKSCQVVGPWNDDETFHVVQNGAAGTEARNVNCTWKNKDYMECMWQAGEKASPDTSYHLSYWHDSMGKAHRCTNFTRKGSCFQCGFKWIVDHVEAIAISIQGSSENIRPFCMVYDTTNHLVKFDPPVMSPPSKNGSEVFLQWTSPAKLLLEYTVEVNGEQKHTFHTNSGKISVDPDRQHTFRVRVKLGDEGQWSEWSQMVVLDAPSSTFPFFLFILIPLCVALLLVILLIYLKRIKLLILPKIPDPGKSLGKMFKEQNENQPTFETANNGETSSLMIVEPAGNEK